MGRRTTTDEETRASWAAELPTEVPLFPLPDHVVLPAAPSPYRVFEPRYRALIQDLLERPEEERWLSVPRLTAGWRDDYHGRPPIHPVAAVGRIASYEPLPGGHFFILFHPLARMRLVEQASSTPYRVAGTRAYPDLPVDQADERRLRVTVTAISQAIYTLVQMLGPAADELAEAAADRTDLRAMLYRVAASAIDEPDDRQVILEERDLVRRAARVLDALTGVVGMAGRHVGAGLVA